MTVIVNVMLKPEILDPQGQAIISALPTLGFDGIESVRQGKRFELKYTESVSEEQLEEVHRIAETLLTNPVIEDFTVEIASATESVKG